MHEFYSRTPQWQRYPAAAAHPKKLVLYYELPHEPADLDVIR